MISSEIFNAAFNAYRDVAGMTHSGGITHALEAAFKIANRNNVTDEMSESLSRILAEAPPDSIQYKIGTDCENQDIWLKLSDIRKLLA